MGRNVEHLGRKPAGVIFNLTVNFKTSRRDLSSDSCRRSQLRMMAVLP
jgi:hypothetical protein